MQSSSLQLLKSKKVQVISIKYLMGPTNQVHYSWCRHLSVVQNLDLVALALYDVLPWMQLKFAMSLVRSWKSTKLLTNLLQMRKKQSSRNVRPRKLYRITFAMKEALSQETTSSCFTPIVRSSSSCLIQMFLTVQVFRLKINLVQKSPVNIRGSSMMKLKTKLIRIVPNISFMTNLH